MPPAGERACGSFLDPTPRTARVLDSSIPPPSQVQSQQPALYSRGIFEFVCGELEQRTQLSRSVARGTVRLAMKQAGLSEEHLTRRSMSVAVRRVLAPMLARRNVEGAGNLCRMMAKVIEVAPAEDFVRQGELAGDRVSLVELPAFRR
jgi:hypothetical protein